MKKFLFLLLLVPATMLAQVPDPLPNTYINDLAGILGKDEVQALNVQLRRLEDSTTVQMAVVLINELPAGMDIADYAREIGRKWHVGNANNGLVYVAAIKQRKQRLEVAKNLEGVITDLEALHLTDAIKPWFRSHNYYAGIRGLISTVEIELRPAQAEQQDLAARELAKKDEDEGICWYWWVLIFGGVGGGLFWVFYPSAESRRRKREEKEREERAIEIMQRNARVSQLTSMRSERPKKVRDETEDERPTIRENYVPPSSYSNYSDNSSSSSSDSSSSSSSYGDWGSGSSGSDSSSGYSGGGSSNDW